MSVLIDILNLLSGPMGGMAYHLILLFCIWAIVGLALSRLSQGEQGRVYQRILLAGALISLSRFLPIAAGLLDRLDGVSLVRLGPPLERFVDTISALLVCSAFVLLPKKKPLSQLLVGILAFLTLALYVVAAFQWTGILADIPSALYNRAPQRWVWELWQLTFLIPAFFYALVGPVKEREALSASLGVFIVAHIAQTFYPVADQIPHVAGWVRLGNLIAFPLLGVSTYLLIFQRFEAEAAELQMVNEQSLAQITNLMSLLEANTKLSRSLDQNNVLIDAAQVIAQELGSDLCALALSPMDQDLAQMPETRELELAVVFDTPDLFLDGDRFAVHDYPLIEHAVTQNRPTILGSQGPAGYDVSASPDEATAIFGLLSSERRGPLIVQPIETSGESTHTKVIGALLVGRTDPSRTYTLEDAHKSESLATYLGTAIENARRHGHTEARIEQMAASQHALETEHVRTKTDLENRLQESREQAAAYMQRMYEAERGEQQAQKDAQQVHREMAQLRQKSQQELVQAKNELRRGIQHATRLTQRIAELDTERIRLTNLIKTLQAERNTRQLGPAVTANDQANASTGPQPQDNAGAGPSARAAVEHSAEMAALLDDLGEPATALLHDTELLANGSASVLDGKQRSLLSRVRANAEHVSLLLANLSTWRDIAAGSLTLKPIPTHITQPIKQALDGVRYRLGARKLRTRLAIGADPVVSLDADIIQRILNNLLDTLCTTAQPGTAIGIQAVVEQSQGQTAALHIVLSGTAALDNSGNAGAPNAVDSEIVQALVQTHGGRVWSSSQPDRRMVFHLIIPFHVADTRPGDGPGTGENARG